jgi:hypothetical protein
MDTAAATLWILVTTAVVDATAALAAGTWQIRWWIPRRIRRRIVADPAAVPGRR